MAIQRPGNAGPNIVLKVKDVPMGTFTPDESKRNLKIPSWKGQTGSETVNVYPSSQKGGGEGRMMNPGTYLSDLDD